MSKGKQICVTIKERDKNALEILKRDGDITPSQIFRAGMEVCAKLKEIDIEKARRVYDASMEYAKRNENNNVDNNISS